MKSEIIFRYNYVRALLFLSELQQFKDVVIEEISQVATYLDCCFKNLFFASSHSKLKLFKKLTIILVTTLFPGQA